MPRVPVLAASLLICAPILQCSSFPSSRALASQYGRAQTSFSYPISGLAASVDTGSGKLQNVALLPKTGSLRPYCLELRARVMRNWFAVMPQGAMMGDKGEVTIELEIGRDGAISNDGPVVEMGSGREILKEAAIKAVRASAPFDPLPQDYQAPTLKLRLVFLYNTLPNRK